MRKPKLESAPDDLPDPPYDKKVASNSYGLDFDVHKFKESDGWAICPPEVRPWVAYAFLMSWAQHPCGSLPSNQEILAVRLGCSPDFLRLHRDRILDGWYLCSDHRYYHPDMVEKVEAMLSKRTTWARKKKGQRQTNQQDNSDVHRGLQGDSRGSLGGVSGESPSSLSCSSSVSSSRSGSKDSPPSPPEGDSGEPSTETPKKRRNGKPKTGIPPCPHQEIIAIYHEKLPELRSVKSNLWAGTGEKDLRARWEHSHEHRSLEFWGAFFETVRTNPHWMGDNNRGWKADLRWLLKLGNFTKVVERMHDPGKDVPAQSGATPDYKAMAEEIEREQNGNVIEGEFKKVG